ncbi:LytTR family transcriptional regulator [Paenibacillus mesophilus]|uniref:LytTR family DNA-binding domain-containing protein n=1 Tax=Paenibacillus mesophilus TaxID=2582849 RepID=UPI00110D5847|nr:LytTR family DNA-binding domain-containing protein [Paenibacillus mesophilus]TMV49481.1 LytTR family transcriptional regulator [Paenibacillus mesophilus]
MKYPVTPDPDNFQQVVMLDLQDIVKIEVNDRSVTFHTLEQVYYPLVWTISTLEPHLQQFGFHRLDRNNLVNLNKVTYFDEERALVFFDSEITNNSKFATISNREKIKVKKEMSSRLEQARKDDNAKM